MRAARKIELPKNFLAPQSLPPSLPTLTSHNNLSDYETRKRSVRTAVSIGKPLSPIPLISFSRQDAPMMRKICD